MKGYISRSYTIWCGLCVHWEQESWRDKKTAEKKWRWGGWKKTKENGWVCPECLKKGKEPHESTDATNP